MTPSATTSTTSSPRRPSATSVEPRTMIHPSSCGSARRHPTPRPNLPSATRVPSPMPGFRALPPSTRKMSQTHLNAKQIAPMEDIYRNRLQSMLAVDEMMGRIVDTLKESGELENTYVFFTSDNGWHAGEHRLTTGKWTAYEEDIRVPL